MSDEEKQQSKPELGDQFEVEKPEIQPHQTPYGLIKPRILEEEMRESYLDYAMSVIVARALPDVRDGLKPVHRRVLYSMHELGLTSHTKFRKSATVVGDVLGKYHPHGDIAVYDSLVRMAQTFAMRYLLVEGQGNFGSMDGDSAAAMRYTEARMSALAEEMLVDIDKNTVDFIANYDGTRQEPTVLPAKVPQLLLNGTLGIAVGMATNIPPHNLGEVIDATMHLIDNSQATIEDLMGYIQGPDFPTAGHIYNIEDVKLAYVTGKGRVLIRAVAEIEERKSDGFRIIISQIPYQVNKADLISKIANLIKLKKLEGITGLRDESDRTSGVRIVIELKANAYPKKILNRLYELTPMQTVFHVNMLALVDGIQPKVLTLKNVLEEYIKHRQVVVRRRTEFLLTRAKDREHILEGLKKALDHIDEIIVTIKKSETKEIAHKNLIEKFDLSDRQSAAILEMRLSALAGLERKKILDELVEKRKLIKELEAILASGKKILEIIKKELLELREKYADERKTKIFKQKVGEFSAEDLIPNEQVIVTLTKDNYIKRLPASTYRSQNRGGKGIAGMSTKKEDTVEHLLVSWTHNDIMFFTDKGRVFTTKVYDLPTASRQAKGQAIVNILQMAPDEKVTAVITLNPKVTEGQKYFFMTTKNGVVKKTLISAYQNVRKSGLIAIKIRPDDELRWVNTTSGADKIIIITKNGQSIYFKEGDARPMGRSASGVRGIRLRVGDKVIVMDVVRSEEIDIFTILERGFGKRTKIKNFNMQKRGGIGTRASKVSAKTGPVVEALITSGDEGDVVIVSSLGQMIRTPLKSVKRLGRDTQGVTLMRLNSGDKVASMTVFKKANILEEDKNKAKTKSSEDIEKNHKEGKLIIKQGSGLKPIVPSVEAAKKKKNPEFKPIVKTQDKQASNDFKPVIKAQIKKQQLKTGGDDSEFKIRHYQGSNEKISESQKRKNDEPNYWGKNLYKRKP